MNPLTSPNRRGQGMSINLIVIVAIGLVILIIAIILVSRSGQKLSENAGNDCIVQGGTCQQTCSETDGYQRITDTNGADTLCKNNKAGAICCRYNFGG
jgi:hypothetical protein